MNVMELMQKFDSILILLCISDKSGLDFMGMIYIAMGHTSMVILSLVYQQSFIGS